MSLALFTNAHCSNPEFISMSNDIETDLNLFTNKTNLIYNTP